jgi:hypothetical protein
MKSFNAQVHINAPATRVWGIVIDTGSWASMDSTIEQVEGAPAAGAKITVHAKRGLAFPLKVVEFTAPQRMVLAGGMLLGLFKGVRRYELTPATDGGTDLTMTEQFSGPLLPLIGRTIPDMQPSFDEFTNNVRQRAEAASAE